MKAMQSTMRWQSINPKRNRFRFYWICQDSEHALASWEFSRYSSGKLNALEGKWLFSE